MIGAPVVLLALTAVDIPAAQASIPEGVWAFLGVLVTAAVSVAIFKGTSRQSDRATATTVQAQERRDAVTGFDELTTHLRGEMQSLRREVKGYREKTSEQDRKIEEQGQELADLREEMRDLARRFREGLAYIERLLDYIVNRAQGGAVHDVPPIPADLIEYLPASLVDTWRTPPSPED